MALISLIDLSTHTHTHTELINKLLASNFNMVQAAFDSFASWSVGQNDKKKRMKMHQRAGGWMVSCGTTTVSTADEITVTPASLLSHIQALQNVHRVHRPPLTCLLLVIWASPSAHWNVPPSLSLSLSSLLFSPLSQHILRNTRVEQCLSPVFSLPPFPPEFIRPETFKLIY